MTKIDAHQHYWNPARGDYDWMPMDNPILARSYQPKDLEPHLERNGIARTVLVQAAASLHETEYMLGIADSTDRVAGVVGWIRFEDKAHAAHLERLAGHPKFLGVRPMIQDIPDVDWMLRPDIRWAYEALIAHDLSFDALGFPRHLANFLTLFNLFPDLRVVIDHCMKPQIRNHNAQNFKEWADGMTRLAQETTAFCKFSGLVTESDGWSADAIRPYAEHLITVFGPGRLMWGSDWPVCRLEAGYDEWHEAAMNLTAHLTPSERDLLFGGTAKAFYKL